MFPVPGYTDDENMWESLCSNIKDKKAKREAKAKHITSKPHVLNSKYSFQVKDREFKIKKYLNTIQTPNPRATNPEDPAALSTAVEDSSNGTH